MAVKKHPDGKRWIADYYYRDAAGALKRREKILTTKQAGVDWIASERAALKGPKRKKRDTRTIAEMIEWFKTRGKYRNAEPKTRKTYDARIRIFQQWCETRGILTLKQFFDPELEEDRYKNPEAYYQHLLDTYKGEGPEGKLQVILTVTNEELRRADRYWTESPWQSLERKKREDKEIRWFTREELKALRDAMTPFELHLFDLLLHTGMRTGEVRNLTWEQVHSDHIKIMPHDEWVPKHGKRRNIPLNKRAMECVEYFRALSGAEKYVIWGERSQGKREIGHNFLLRHYSWIKARATKATGLTFKGAVVHTFRATCGSLMLQNGVPIAFVSSFLGHSDIQTTQKHYASLTQENLHFAAQALDGLGM